MPYPIETALDDKTDDRNRLTTAFRLILAVPHLLLVGGGGGGSFGGAANGGDAGDPFLAFLSAGAMNVALAGTSFISWFAILFTGKMPEGLWLFGAYVVGWQYRVYAYTGLLRDEYPPFGDAAAPGGYPAYFRALPPAGDRNRLTVFFRLFMVIPHFIVLVFLAIAWFIVTVIAWFAILFAGSYPADLYRFAAGVLCWGTRVNAYLYLLTDDYPPFSLDRDPVYGPPAPAPTTSG